MPWARWYLYYWGMYQYQTGWWRWWCQKRAVVSYSLDVEGIDLNGDNPNTNWEPDGKRVENWNNGTPIKKKTWGTLGKAASKLKKQLSHRILFALKQDFGSGKYPHGRFQSRCLVWCRSYGWHSTCWSMGCFFLSWMAEMHQGVVFNLIIIG